MNKRHLPYNILLVITIASVTLMALSSLLLRRSSFAVTVGYAIPQPAASEVAARPPPVYARQVDPLPQGHPESAEDGASDAILSVQFPLELNRATYGQLLFIPGVGDVTAQRIMQYREHLGGYSRLSQLLDIHGIGENTYQRITAYLYLDGEEEEIPPDDGENDNDDDHDEYGEWEEP